jgi:hypothetical protein
MIPIRRVSLLFEEIYDLAVCNKNKLNNKQYKQSKMIAK